MSTKWLWTSAAVVALALPVGAQQSQQSQQSQSQERQVGTSGAVAAAEVEDIVDNPEQYYGKSVTISGGVGDVLGPRFFNIQEEGVIDVDDQLLVLSKKPLQNLTEDSVVQVRGTVRQFVKADLEREYGITDWSEWGFDDDEMFETYDRRPVVVADAVDVRQNKDK